MIKKNVLLTALAIAGFAVTTSAQTVPNYLPSNGLVGWWPFNGNANDESGNGVNGNVLGATLSSDRFGISNSSYLFNGSSNVINCGNGTNQLLNLIGSVTISAWVQANCFGCGNYANSIVAKHRWGSPNGYMFGFWLGGSTGMINYAATPNFDPSTYPAGQTGYISANIWKNCVVVYDSNSTLLKYYIDGNLVDTKLLSFNMTANTDDLVFGAQRNGAATGYLDFFSGKIDDIGIWNRALTQQEITNLNNGSSSGINFNDFKKIKIFPNPTNDYITIDNGDLDNLSGHQIKISNALGQQVFQSAITQQQFYVDMSTWGGNGIYFVNLINAQGVTIETRKIVLQ